MKIEWTAKEANPGIIVAKPGCNERWMIGYAGFVRLIEDHPSEKRYTLNSMIDGSVLGPWTKEELAVKLTEGEKIPADILDNPRFEFPRVRA